MKKILIVEDSSLLRNDLKRMLESIPDLLLVGEAEDYSDAVNINYEQKPDIILLDIDLKAGTGLDVLTNIKNGVSKPVVIMFTNYSEPAFRKTTKQLGADFFFDKSDDINGLIELLKTLSSRH